jgi:HEAT repeat protein
MSGSILIALGDARDPRAGPALVEILGHKDPRVRRDAARALGHSKYPPAVKALKQVFERAEEDEEVRLYAAVGAARLGSKEGLPALRGLLGSRSAAIRSRAVFALGEHGGVAEVGRIAGVLKDDVEGVREDTVEALRKIGTREVWGPLVEATRDANYQVRSVAMGHLRRLTKEAFDDPAAWQEWWAKQSAGQTGSDQPGGGQGTKGERPPQGGGK